MIIDQLKTIIRSNCKQFVKENNSLTKEFLDSKELKQKCKDSLETIYPLIMAGEEYTLSEDDFEEKYTIALKDVRYSFQTVMTPSLSIRNDYNSDTWLTKDRINKIGWDNEDVKTYRARYLKYLEKIGRSKTVIEETSRSSLEIIKKIGDPENQNNFFVKGLVVGSVQSGKTSNFNALINSSIDVGYKLIIVLSGIMEDLRRQTQIRIEKEIEGKMTGQNRFIGVGEIASFGQLGQHKDVNQVIIPTSAQNDFNRTMQEAQFSLNNTNILICKKNTSVLQNLLLWLREYLSENNDKHNIPFLIVDDEADNASLNNLGHKGAEFANKINGHIRALLALFNRKTYIGYTATPFANVLQDWNKEPEKKWIVKDTKNKVDLSFDQVGNLFPDDFIELLIPPSDYIGAKHFFETRIEEITKIEPLLARPVTDHIESFPERVEILSDGTLKGIKRYNNKNEFEEDPHAVQKFGTYKDYLQSTRATTKDDLYPIEIPKSLEEAIECFIISIAIRLARRPEMIQSKLFQRHHTMLIHISRFSYWQCTTKKLIQEKVKNLEVSLNNDHLHSEMSVYVEFERVWNKYYQYAINNIREFLPPDYEDEYLSKKSFNEVKQYLVEAINGIEVKAVNTVEKDVLDYEGSEKKYIVVGGNKLSRGFTLEGLTINYFLRNTNYADTLLQMGRWFGYRLGYLDCCKLFTTEETLEKYDQTTRTIEELEDEFRYLQKNKKKPIDYAVKVFKNPGVLKVTRPAILKNAITEKWSFEDKLIQTTELKITQQTISESWRNFRDVYAKYADQFKYDQENNVILLRTNLEGLSNFIESLNTYTENFEKDAIFRFIKLCNESDKLTNWTIAIKTSGDAKKKISQEESGFIEEVILTKRRSPKETSIYYDKLLTHNIFKISGKSANILSSGKDMSFTLLPEEIEKAEKEFQDTNPDKSIPERVYREKMKDNEGLMVIYLMDPEAVFNSDELRKKATNENIDMKTPIIGFALGIPPLQADIGEDYLINRNIKIDEEDGVQEDFGDEFEGIESDL